MISFNCGFLCLVVINGDHSKLIVSFIYIYIYAYVYYIVYRIL